MIDAQACYDTAEYLQLAGNYDEAIEHFERSGLWDSHERALYWMYKTEKFDVFRRELEWALALRHTSPLLATLSTRDSANFGVEDCFGFGMRPIEFIYHSRIEPLTEPDGQLLNDLLRNIPHAKIEEESRAACTTAFSQQGNC